MRSDLHALCQSCYRLLVPGGKPKFYEKPGHKNAECCHCGESAENIWLQADPDTMNCGGSGGVHTEVE